MKKTSWLCLIFYLVIVSAPSLGQNAPTSPSVIATTHLDKTALWVGDPLRYTIRLVHDKNVEFVLENLKPKNFRLAPFVVRDTRIRQTSFGGGRRFLEISLLLTTYESGKPELTIPSINLYYFVRVQGRIANQDTAAKSVLVPATKVRLASTLAGDDPELRDEKAASEIPLRMWLVPLLLGFVGLMLPGFRAGRWIWRTLRVEDSENAQRDLQARQQAKQDFLERIRVIEVKSPGGILAFCTAVAEFLRGDICQWLQVDGAGLTPDELEAALKNTEGGSSLAPEIKAILEKCDWARYAKDGPDSGEEWAGEMLQEVESLVGRLEV